MYKEVADRWIEALRDPSRTQGEFLLMDKGGGFCCLGVLCDISGFGEWDKKNYYQTGDEEAIRVVPDSVKRWAGLFCSAGSFPDRFSDYTSLADMNDSGKTFVEIADFIEKNWEVL